MCEEGLIVFRIGENGFSAYGLMMAAAALCGLALMVLLGRKSCGTEKTLTAGLCALVGAVLGGHLVYCLCNLGTLIADYEQGISILWQPWTGGYTLYGGILGGLAGIALYSLRDRDRLPALLDAAAPGAMLAVAIGRIGEIFTNQGLGEYIEDELLMRFPFAVAVRFEDYDDYVEWRVPVFFYEALAALVLMVVALMMLKKLKQPGRTAGNILTLFGAVQILLEQIRRDDYIRFGFVRFTQLAAVILMTFVLGLRVAARIREQGRNRGTILRPVLFVLCIGTIILIEFVLEKPLIRPYLCICAFLNAVAAAWLLEEESTTDNRITRRLISAGALGVTVTSIALIVLGIEWENFLLMVMMAMTLMALSYAVIGGNRKKT